MAEVSGGETSSWARAALAAMMVLAASCGSDPRQTQEQPQQPQTSANGGTGSELIDVVVDRTVTEFEGAGLTVDEGCIRQLAAQLPPADLSALAEASHDTAPDATDPELSDAANELAGRLLACTDYKAAANETGLTVETGVPAAAEPTLDTCGLIDKAQLAKLYTGLGEGVAMATLSPWGEGQQCAWESSSGERVRVSVVDGIDISAWQTEASNGDGLSDGKPVTGLGDKAFVGRGTIGFVRGDRLVQIDCFPTFDITPALLTETATAVEGAL